MRRAEWAKIDPLGHSDDVSSRKVNTSAVLRRKTIHQQLLALNSGKRRGSVKGIVNASRLSQLVEARYVAQVECIPSHKPSLHRQLPEVATGVLVADAESALVALSAHLQTVHAFGVTPSQTSCLLRAMQQVVKHLQSDDAVLATKERVDSLEAAEVVAACLPSCS